MKRKINVYLIVIIITVIFAYMIFKPNKVTEDSNIADISQLDQENNSQAAHYSDTQAVAVVMSSENKNGDTRAMAIHDDEIGCTTYAWTKKEVICVNPINESENMQVLSKIDP